MAHHQPARRARLELIGASMLIGFTTLLIFQLAGEVISRTLNLPVPGPVVGMVLLFGFLVSRGGAPAGLRSAGEGLLKYLALLYVPAGVGLMVHFRLIASDWVAIAAALVISTFLSLAATALILKVLQRKRGGSA